LYDGQFSARAAAPSSSETKGLKALPSSARRARLAGIAIDPNAKRALLRTAQQPQARWVEQGESIDGWLLQVVREQAVVVVSRQQALELRLYPAQGPSPPQQ